MPLVAALLLLLSLAAVPSATRAGVEPDSLTLRSRDSVATVTLESGTVRLSGTVDSDSTRTAFVRKKKSPGRAMLYSAILPGGGQAYNETYWKVPIVFGFTLYFTSEWLNYNRRYQDNRDQYAASVALDGSGDARLLTARDFYKSERDSFTWYLFLTYIINIADAYVDASLYDFNVGGDLSLRVMPGSSSAHPTPAGLTLRMGF